MTVFRQFTKTNIDLFTSQMRCEFRIEFFGFNQKFHATYGTFIVAGEYDNFKLTLKNGQSPTNVIDSLYADATSGDDTVNGMRFSTKDKDNDRLANGNCAETYGGGWWYNRCGQTNVNGGNERRTMFWHPTIPVKQSMDWVQLKVRPVYVDWLQVDTSGLKGKSDTWNLLLL